MPPRSRQRSQPFMLRDAADQALADVTPRRFPRWVLWALAAVIIVIVSALWTLRRA